MTFERTGPSDTLDYLDEFQRARVAALYEARTVTVLRVPSPSVTVAESFDLIELARFITGELDPVSLPTAVLVSCSRCSSSGGSNPNAEDPNRG